MDDVDLFSDELIARLLSKREIVINTNDVLIAIKRVFEFNWAIVGWEALIKYEDGRVGHSFALCNWCRNNKVY
ncbi:hypothetical protein [Cohnella mopanensis]|uniref:hypothetical protein n=1 Tax=Cohnella mopanensis TaxID=2911966 RepID=UPI001EF7F3C3|nr:hypothetical protein [Cohnella mopanensis]